MELPLMPTRRILDPSDPEPCAGCGDCCRYVTAQIKSPRSRADYDEIRWFLLHENIQVFVDEDGWYVEFATKCRKLDGWRCTIYADRPRVCSDYPVEDCTRYGAGEPHLHLFRTEREYLDYLQRHRPRAFGWVMSPRGPLRASRAAHAIPLSRAQCARPPARPTIPAPGPAAATR